MPDEKSEGQQIFLCQLTRQVPVQAVGGNFCTGAATLTDIEPVTQVIHGVRAFINRLPDITLGDCIANTYIHVEIKPVAFKIYSG